MGQGLGLEQVLANISSDTLSLCIYVLLKIYGIVLHMCLQSGILYILFLDLFFSLNNMCLEIQLCLSIVT